MGNRLIRTCLYKQSPNHPTGGHLALTTLIVQRMVFVYSYGPLLRLVLVKDLRFVWSCFASATDLRFVSSQLGSATDLCFVSVS